MEHPASKSLGYFLHTFIELQNNSCKNNPRGRIAQPLRAKRIVFVLFRDFEAGRSLRLVNPILNELLR